MNNPKPEHRITAVEKRVTHIEGAIEELASDTDGNFRALRQELKDSFLDIGKAFDLNASNIETVKRDVAQIKTDLAELKSMMMQLLQKKSGE
jgi:ribosomal protein L29